MASRRLALAAVVGDALADQVIRQVDRPSMINLWGSGATNGDSLGLFLDKTSIMESGEVNVESAADVIAINIDQLVFNTVVGRGLLRIPITAVTTEIQFLLSVEPII